MTKVEMRIYTDKEGNEVTEYTSRDMRLRTTNVDGQRLFNYSDIQSFIGYDAEEVFEFLSEAMGDELFNYLADDSKEIIN